MVDLSPTRRPTESSKLTSLPVAGFARSVAPIALTGRSMTRYSRFLASWGLLLCCAGCWSADGSPDGGSSAVAPGGTDSTAVATGAAVPAAQDSALRSAAESIVAFLRGTTAFETLSVAETVDLVIPAEGGGTRRRVSREALRDRHAWTVQIHSQQYSLVPAANLTEMTVAPNRHFNCREGSLLARVPEFAESPHAGVRLEPPDADSCLQVWNATFVFETASGHPRLTAAIYDQWEW